MTEKNARLELAERIAGHLGPVNFVTRSERDLIVAALRAEAEPVAWQDDPAADDRWNAGVDFVMKLLCDYLGVEHASVTWDAATETVEGDVSAVIGNILRAKFGEDWGPDVAPQPAAESEPVACSTKLMNAWNGLLRDVETVFQIIEREGSERMRNAMADLPMRVRQELSTERTEEKYDNA